MRIISLLAVLILTLGFALNSRLPTKTYPQDYFRSPTDQPIRLSGTFGELRPNHLHSGIDIKATDGKNGEPLYAVADGYIARIKVQSGGYGNALYLVHPNGYMSVYAHLQNFNSKIAAYVKKVQYEKKSFGVDLYLNAQTFPVKKGQQIGNLGTSGRSFGPHLHFEIRNNATQKPINPLLFGIEMTDNIAPKLHNLKVYHLNDKKETIGTRTYGLSQNGNNYYLQGDTLEIGAWRAGFGLKAYDHHDGVSNWNGIYALEVYENGNLIHGFDMETFAFGESRYINAHLDYEELQLNKSYFNRSYALPGNRLSIYEKNEGIVTLHKHQPAHIKMVAMDVDGNKSILDFWVKRVEVQVAKSKRFNYSFPYNQANIINNSSLKATFPKGTFYENAYLSYKTTTDHSDGVYSSMHHIHDVTIPVHKYYDLAIRPVGLPEYLKNKAFIAFCEDNTIESCGGQWKDGFLKARVRSLGDYCIMVDDVPPQIIPIAFNNDMRGRTKMTFKITDSMPTTGKAKGLSYQAMVDGKWILMEYDEKKNLLTHHFDDRISAGAHTLKLRVTDDRGNRTLLERSFKR